MGLFDHMTREEVEKMAEVTGFFMVTAQTFLPKDVYESVMAVAKLGYVRWVTNGKPTNDMSNLPPGWVVQTEPDDE